MKLINKISLLIMLQGIWLSGATARENLPVNAQTDNELLNEKTNCVRNGNIHYCFFVPMIEKGNIRKSAKKVILRETFDYPDGPLPSNWWSEGNAAKIKDGRLLMDADTTAYRASTTWFDYKLSGNIRIEFDVRIESSSDTANNINCFFMYNDPEGKSLRESKDKRKDGVYNHYHKLNGYIFTFVANKNPNDARIRFRDNPGFNLLKEDFGAECKAGRTYHIRIEKRGNRFVYWMDNKKLLKKIDNEYNELHDEGIFGFRTWHTTLWWDNLVITGI